MSTGPTDAPGKSVKKARHTDTELEEFRNLMHPPSTFEDGFTWPAFFGALFIGLLMVPGTMYMGLVAGEQDVDEAAKWVTVILFIEVARRANKQLKNAEIFTLFFLTTAAVAGPFSGFLFKQFYAQSAAARSQGIVDHLPIWFAPTDPDVLAERSFFMWEWLPAIGLGLFGMFMSKLDNMVLGYGLFRMASDIEKLPFPMAPIGAQGILALSEEQEEEKTSASVDETEDASGEQRPASWRWRVFSMGSIIGLLFGMLYLGLPTITGALLGEPIVLLPIPFIDWTEQTQDMLPAVATGLSMDLTNVLMGMVLPFFAMVGAFIGLLITFVLNPILYSGVDLFGMQMDPILTSWKPGNSTVETMFRNQIDFYFSFGIGTALAIAAAGFWASGKGIAQLIRQRKKKKEDIIGGDPLAVPEGRGDIPVRWIIMTYLVTTGAYIGLSGYLIDWHKGVMAVMFFYGFLYTPLISYATARLEGIAGQVVQIPMVREVSFILSGYSGVAVWFLPIPMHDYGRMTVFYRQCELTGTKFWSIWKSQLILTPIIIIAGLFFSNFIWGLAEVPGPQYPYAQEMWELQAENQSILFSSTLEGFSQFERAFVWEYLAAGFGLAMVGFGTMSALGWPVFLTYGIIRGLGQTQPHAVIPQFIGALIGRYYFQKKLGLTWRQYIPVVVAGFSCGMGLIATLSIGFTFLSKSVFQMPF